MHTVLKNKNTTSLRTPIGDLLRGARKADRVGSAAGGLPDAACKAAHHQVLLLLGEAGGVHHVEPEGDPRVHLVNVISNLTLT